MAGKFNYKTVWILLLATALVVFAVVAIPVWLIQPFAPQTENALRISYFLKTWSPFFTPAALLISIVLGVYLWRNSRRWFGKAFLLIPFIIIFFGVWFARQNHFEWMFNPLAQADFVKAGEADFVADDDMVLAVKLNGEAVAYPVRQMAYHHIAQDVVGGTPITATY
jgi:hypothetical protein